MEEKRFYGLGMNIDFADNELISCVTYSNEFLDHNPGDSRACVSDVRHLHGDTHWCYFSPTFFKRFHDLQKKTLQFSTSLKSTEVDEVWKHLAAGAVAGAVSRTCTAPLDRLKVALQASHDPKFTLRRMFYNMLNDGGVLSFWRGNGINIVKVVPEMAFKFSIYNEVKSYIKARKSSSKLDIRERFMAGSLAGVLSQSILFPLEVVKTRLVLRRTGESCWSCVRDICTNKRGFYKGFLPNVLGIIPYAGTDLAIYETLKGSYSSRTNRDPGVVVLLAFGVFSSSVATVVSYPLNLMKIRLQAQRGNTRAGHSMSATLGSILRVEGVRGLYRGLLANLMKVAPSVGIGYVVYEVSRANMGATMS